MTRALSIIMLLCAAPGGARAQDADSARAAFDEANRQYAAENFQLALEGFQRAHDLLEGDAERQTMMLFNIGKAQEALGLYEEAAATYRRYLADAPGDAAFRAETRDRVRELDARLRARGEQGDPASPPPPPVSPPPAPSDAGDDTSLVAGITLGVLGAAAILASIGPGLVASSDASELERMCPGGACPSSAQGLIDSASTLSLLTDALWIGGLSLAAVGIVLVVIGASSGGDDTPTVACSPLGCSIMGSF